MNDWRLLKESQGTQKSLRSAKQQARMQALLEQAKQIALQEMITQLEAQFTFHR